MHIPPPSAIINILIGIRAVGIFAHHGRRKLLRDTVLVLMAVWVVFFTCTAYADAFAHDPGQAAAASYMCYVSLRAHAISAADCEQALLTYDDVLAQWRESLFASLLLCRACGPFLPASAFSAADGMSLRFSQTPRVSLLSLPMGGNSPPPTAFAAMLKCMRVSACV